MWTDGFASTYDVVPAWHPHAAVLCYFVSFYVPLCKEGVRRRTTVIGMLGALGKINFTSSNFCRRRQFSASPTQPAPLSPRPWAMITVAVCRFTAGMMRAVGGGILCSWWGWCWEYGSIVDGKVGARGKRGVTGVGERERRES